VVEDLSKRSAQEVLDDHLTLAENWGVEGDIERIVEEDIRRNVSEDIVILINRGGGGFHGHEGVRQLAQMLGEELPEHLPFDYTYRAVEGRVAFLEWAYEDANVRVRDGVDSYLIENGKIVAQTIHYTVEQK
jgi:SnoaL-like domain